MDNQPQFTYDLFISYVETDRAWVEGYLLDALTQAGVRTISETAFRLGAPRLVEFERAVQQSRRTLLILSPAYLADGYAQFVDLLAQSYGAETTTWPVIPLILTPVKLPPRLAQLVALDATDADRQVEAIARLCAELRLPIPTAPSPPACPYPGMTPFTEADAGRFYGREAETEELLARLRLHPFLAVIGPSGSGKSSLIFAGLIPALRRSTLFAGEWVVKMMRPGATPLTTLARTLGIPGQISASSTDFGGLLRTKEGMSADQRLLLVVDQCEELFAQPDPDSNPEAVPFQQALLRLAETPGCYVVLTARADFYADLMSSPLWRQIQAHRYEVTLLGASGLRQAIVRPAEDVGVYVEATLVERLIADAAGEPGVLPFVQETLNLLWEKLERRFLPLRAYEALVLPVAAYGASPRTGLQVAMARRGDAALAGLSAQQLTIARRIFLRLVQFGEGRADMRRQQRVAALSSEGDDPVDFEHALAHLAAARLLTLSGEADDDDRRADIAHEALIAGWPILTRWLVERREAEQVRRRLEAKAAEWARLGQGTSGLLDNVELREAERWLAGSDAVDLGYSAALPALAHASRAALDEAMRQKEAFRQRELMLERRGRRRLQWLVAVIAGLLLVTSGFLGRLEWLRIRARISGEVRPVSGLSVALERYEVTNRRYAYCVQAGHCLSPPPQLSTYHTPDNEDRPVAGIDALQAAAFCAWIGRRLPTMAEWQAAATDGAGARWPWTDEQQIFDFANLHRSGPLDLDRPPDPVGRRRPTAPGFYDLVGNVVEWTATAWRDSGPAPGTPWDGQSATVPRDLTTVGGSYLTTPSSFGPINAAATVRAADLGFRCAEDHPR